MRIFGRDSRRDQFNLRAKGASIINSLILSEQINVDSVQYGCEKRIPSEDSERVMPDGGRIFGRAMLSLLQ